MPGVATARGGNALRAAVDRVDRFPPPIGDPELSRIDSYDDYDYVDAPYDDYQDYEDAPEDK